MSVKDAISRRGRIPFISRLRLLMDRDLGVGNFLDRTVRVARDPEVPYLWAQRIDSDGNVRLEALSLAGIVERRDAYAAWYHREGVRKGDPVGVYLGEGIDSFLQFLALSALGAIPALVNGRMDPAIARIYLERIGVTGLVVDNRRRKAIEDAGGLPETVRFSVAPEDLPSSTSEESRLPAVFPYRHGEHDPVMLCHTSGTTGIPKAAMFGHRQFFVGKRKRLVSFASNNDRMLSALPQSHSAGISYLMTATLLGLPTLVMADTSGDAVLREMKDLRPTIVVAFPQTYAELAALDLAEGGDSVHTWYNTGDSAHEAHIRALIRHGRRPSRFGGRPGSRFVDGLGSSEMGMALFRKVSEPESNDYSRCVGRPLPVVESVVVLDDEGRELGDGRPGRLAVKTPTMTPGYWNNSNLTMQSSLYGYWLTGDIVYRDDDGKFFHLDRVPDVIHTVPEPTYSLPMEEAILAECSNVVDCSVFAVNAPDGESGQVAFATVKLKAGEEEPRDLLRMLNQALAKRNLTELRGARISGDETDFPVGPTGKVLKRRLREHFADVLNQNSGD